LRCNITSGNSRNWQPQLQRKYINPKNSHKNKLTHEGVNTQPCYVDCCSWLGSWHMLVSIIMLDHCRVPIHSLETRDRSFLASSHLFSTSALIWLWTSSIHDLQSQKFLEKDSLPAAKHTQERIETFVPIEHAFHTTGQQRCYSHLLLLRFTTISHPIGWSKNVEEKITYSSVPTLLLKTTYYMSQLQCSKILKCYQ
jgi:hypothetical protein